VTTLYDFSATTIDGQELRSEKGGMLGAKIKWNFTKFLVNRNGEVVKRYASTTKPDNLTGDIDDVLRS